MVLFCDILEQKKSDYFWNIEVTTMEFVKMRMEFINAWEQTRRDFNMKNPCSLWQPWKKDFYQNKGKIN